MRVLIADDSAMVCQRLTALLSPLDGVTVAGEAHDVSQTIESFERLRPEAVILDIQMTGGSGFDILKRVKSRAPDSIVIMTTNSPFSRIRERYLDAGADYFFDKSSEFEKVIDVFGQLSDVEREEELVPA